MRKWASAGPGVSRRSSILLGYMETISQPNHLFLASLKITFQTLLTQEKHESQDVLKEKCIMFPGHGNNDNDPHY